MRVYSVGDGEKVYEQDGCVGTRLYRSGDVEYVHLALQPGGEIVEHILPIPVSFCVLRGEGTVLVDGQPEKVPAHGMVECPPHVSRGWKNESGSLLEVLVIKQEINRG